MVGGVGILGRWFRGGRVVVFVIVIVVLVVVVVGNMEVGVGIRRWWCVVNCTCWRDEVVGVYVMGGGCIRRGS